MSTQSNQSQHRIDAVRRGDDIMRMNQTATAEELKRIPIGLLEVTQRSYPGIGSWRGFMIK
ncbi:hypothetical protein M5D96_007755 [Drosophila gunungcola]|uniref:Uncharacterized protein n=1 Tax=Drosophila gunungcola TaxID=103775 RepID=A0A9P9YL59_9MUSC|nr:hypothetical protein M5D96_007755 [Drosophila gunungcola]